MELKNIDEKDLIISLIRDNLINIKLMSGLNALGIYADDYNANLGEIVFLLMGFENLEQADLIFEDIYLANAQRVKYINLSSSKDQLNALSEEIYNDLVFAKAICNTRHKADNI